MMSADNGNFSLSGLVAAGSLCLAASAAHAASATDTAVRMVAQEGLAIALASNVLVTQVELLEFSKVGKCERGRNGTGSAKLISETKTGKDSATAEAMYYFDDSCQTGYIDEKANLEKTGKDTISISATERYTGLQGQNLGSMALTESADLAAKTVVIGLGQFTPATGAPTVSLGLTCTLNSAYSCEGGIAQSFPNLNLSLASVTPLTLTFGGKKGQTVSFKGNRPNRETGATGALAITEINGHALGISGTGAAYGKAATKGRAAELALFPPAPTFWDIVDKAHGVKFSIKVVSETTRDVAGTVTSLSDGATLAAITADQSGTGTIVYAGEETDAITSWLLAD